MHNLMEFVMRFVTLGPQGSCHDNAIQHYLEHHNVKMFEVIFISDFLIGLELIYRNKADYLVQCSAHPQVHLITEKYPSEIKVVDTFIFPTKEIALLERKEIKTPNTIGLVGLCEGYLEGITYSNFIYEYAKPIVGRGLLEGKYDAGITHYEYYKNFPNRFRVRKYIGQILTTWIVYGHDSIFKGDILSIMPIGFFNFRTF